jgi:hypothetical protein
MALRWACPNRREGYSRHKECRHTRHFANKTSDRGFHCVFSLQKIWSGCSSVVAMADVDFAARRRGKNRRINATPRHKQRHGPVVRAIYLGFFVIASPPVLFLHQACLVGRQSRRNAKARPRKERNDGDA